MSENSFTLSEESILRRVPRVVAPEQALLLEALAYSADSIDMAYRLMLRIANAVGENPENLTRSVQIQLLNNAWAMVDALHNMRQILQALKTSGSTAMRFLTEYESATHLRNAMDHIKDQAKNLALKRKAEPPLIGALGYNFVPTEAIVTAEDGTIKELTRGVAVTTSIGRLRKKTNMTLANPASEGPLQENIFGLRLEAFDYSIELMPAYRDFVALVTAMDKAFAKSIPEQARRLADENGVSYDELMEHFGAGLSTFAIWESTTHLRSATPTEVPPA
ncbi:hypothetical protein AB0H49_34310 [Nocardia sp. NPDC050713]|uniref:hypothetical protein n=1 Tax=Nocardia sp. NPDC050713 TaxID=3154511 RepID=UPI0033FF4025